jgi:hypothetical protein
VAIKRKPLPLHLEIHRHRGNPVGLIRSSYREHGKVKHSTHGRITGLTLEQLKLLQAAFRGDVVPKGSAEDFQILASKEYGASYALLELAKQLGLAPCSLLAQRSLGTGLPGDDRRTHRLRRQQTGAV